MESLHRILVPIDMSTFSMSAVQYAEDIAERFGSEVIVLHIAEDDEPLAKAAMGRKETNEETAVRIKGAVSRLLLDHNIVTQSIRIEVRFGVPAAEIVRSSVELHSDLIVMSTHGRSGLSHILMGSVAERVVRTAACPVLTIKPDEFRELVNVTQGDVEEGLHIS